MVQLMTKNVWKTETTVFYTRSNKHRNQFGNYDSACSRKEISWNARLPSGRIVAGFPTKRAALAAVESDIQQTLDSYCDFMEQMI
jgi:hypothetical protein